MSFFSEVERTVERAFRKFTERAFGPGNSDELLLVHRAILEEIEGKIQTVQRGQRMFPYNYVHVRLASADADRRATQRMAFVQDKRLENDIREALQGAACDIPKGFALEVETIEEGPAFQIEYAIRELAQPVEEPAAPAPEPPPVLSPGRLVVVRGKAALESYALEKPRTNLGRMQELTDSQQRIIRRNDLVFEEGADDANATVSRAHAHVRFDRATGEYRICDDESEYGTRIFRDGQSVEVPAGNRRGERLQAGDEIYLGRACLRFER